MALAVLGTLATAAPSRAAIGQVPLPDPATLAIQRAQYLSLAELGLRQARRHWWNARLGWYDELNTRFDAVSKARGTPAEAA